MEREDPVNSFSQEQKHAQSMKALKEAMLQLSMSRNPSCSQSQQEVIQKLIDVSLPSLISSPLRIPKHPPYAGMIITALRELKRKKGSTIRSISSFIKSTYQDLPLAHEGLLTHHLEKLVKVGEVVSVTKSLYTLPNSMHNNSNSENQQKEDSLPMHNNNNSENQEQEGSLPMHDTSSSENQHQEGKQQLIIVGRKKLEERINNNIKRGRLVALPEDHPTSVVEVIEPVNVDDVGGGLMSLSERPPTTVVIVQALPTMSPELGRRASFNKKSELAREHGEVGNNAGQDDATVCKHSPEQQQQPRRRGRLPKKMLEDKEKQPQVATQEDSGALTAPLDRQSASAIESVKPIKGRLPGCGRGRHPRKKNEAGQVQEKMGNIVDKKAMADANADPGDDPSVHHHTLKQKPRRQGRYQKQGIVMEDDDQGLTTMHGRHPVIETVKPLQILFPLGGHGEAHNKESEAAQPQEVQNMQLPRRRGRLSLTPNEN